MSGIFQLHRDRNATTRNHRQQFSGHRANVMAAICSAQRMDADRLCILGAGNGNDLELLELLQRFAAIHLVDLDADALAHAVANAHCLDRITMQGDCDVSGWMHQLETFRDKQLHDSDVSDLLATSRNSQIEIQNAPFDVVVSTCILTQLIDSVLQIVQPGPQLLQLAVEARRRHLQLMLDSLVDGGRGLLITDFVATTTLPDLMQIPEHEFQNRMTQALVDGNFFTGANPLAIRRLLTEDSGFNQQLSEVEVMPPWRWDHWSQAIRRRLHSLRESTKEQSSPSVASITACVYRIHLCCIRPHLPLQTTAAKALTGKCLHRPILSVRCTSCSLENR